MRRASGFTLTELMITLAVLGLLVAAGLPSMSTFVKGQRVKAAVSDVYASLIFARSEAIKRNQRVVLCASSDGTGCANSPNWAQGWIVFIDSDGDGYVGAVADILKRQGAFPTVNLTGTASNATFLLDGRVNASVADFVVSSSDTPSITARCVRLDLGGRPNIRVDTNGNSADGCS
jgi:type IV fimbrial biogenesis protein FimT